jgi:hypothetical protein
MTWKRPATSDQYSVGQSLAHGLGVGRGQVDRHVGDPKPPCLRLGGHPRGDHRRATALDLGQEATGAGDVDEPSVPTITHQQPPVRVRDPGPDRLAAAGLVDPEDLHVRQGRGQGCAHVSDERVMHRGPPHLLVRGRLDHAPMLLSHRVGKLGT